MRAGYTWGMSTPDQQTFRPGEQVPVSGIYECDCGQNHRFSTDVKGHPFPPVPEDCSGATWKLQTPAHPE